MFCIATRVQLQEAPYSAELLARNRTQQHASIGIFYMHKHHYYCVIDQFTKINLPVMYEHQNK